MLALITGVGFLTRAWMLGDKSLWLDEAFSWSMAKMSLAEQIRAQILESLGLSEEDLKAMDADQRKAVEDEIRQAIGRAMGVEKQRDNAATDIADGGSDYA